MEHYNNNTSKATIKPTKVSQIFNNYLAIKNSERTLMDIFLWWERKRIAFNAVILSLCYVSFKIEELTGSVSGDLFTRRELIVFIIAYNIIYSNFCVLEFFIKKSKNFAPFVFKNALYISTGYVTVPTVLHLLESIRF